MINNTLHIPHGQYGVVYADPPWSYQMYSDKGYDKSPQTHYDCMPLADIKALRDQIIFNTAPDCWVFMWAVWPMMPEALEVLNAWGFKYVTGGAWHKKTKHDKSAFGTGYVLRSASEPFLIGKIGSPEIKNRSTRNIIEAKVREHSRKPDETIPFIENLFNGPYLELFGRQQRAGWTVVGNETDKFSEAA